jgi:hypothetical protein
LKRIIRDKDLTERQGDGVTEKLLLGLLLSETSKVSSFAGLFKYAETAQDLIFLVR